MTKQCPGKDGYKGRCTYIGGCDGSCLYLGRGEAKECRTCGGLKGVSAFSRDRSKKDGRKLHCKVCLRKKYSTPEKESNLIDYMVSRYGG